MATRWPLTGRSNEMARIEAAIAASRLAGIVVSGPMGVGKSRLAREALVHASSRGVETRWVVGTSSARAVPLGAFTEWAPRDVTDTVQLVRGVIESLTSATSMPSPVVLGVDDVHLLDELSTFVVQQIVQRDAAKVVLTVRDGEPVPAGVQEIWRGADFERLDLQPLSNDQTHELLIATLGGPVDPAAAECLWKLTRGNALYLHNLVEQGLASGGIARGDRHWRLTGEPVVPADLVELVESRIGELPADVADVVDVLAVAEPLELESLQRITNSDAVEQADARGLIALESIDGKVEVRVAHPLYGEVRRKHAPPTRLRRLRALAVHELARSERCDELRLIVRRAALSLDSDLARDPDLLLRAAQGAISLADLVLASRLSDTAIRAGGGAEAYLVRAHALSWLGRGWEADALLLDIPAAQLDDANRSRVAFLRAMNALCALADPALAKDIVDDTPPSAHGCVDAFYSVYWAAMGEPEPSRKSAETVAIDQLPAVVGAVTTWGMAIAHGDAGRTSDALTTAESGFAIANNAFDAAQMRFVIADAYVGALLLSGRVGEAVKASERLRRQANDLPGPAQLLSSALAGRAALGAGCVRTAYSLLEPAVDLIFASGDTNGFGYQYGIPHTTALAMLGMTDEAAAAFAALQEHRYPSWRYLDYAYGVAEAWVLASRGAIGQAVKTVLAAGDTACTKGQFAAEVMCLQTATQFGDPSCGQRLHDLEAIVEGPRVGIAARFAVAMRAGDGDGLAKVSTEYQRIGDLVAAVDAAALAAVAYRSRDLRGSSFDCSTRAKALAEQCGGAWTPALRSAAEPLPITDREREIVMLLGRGLSSRAVANQLFLSVRTVESHIYNAMCKTGTSCRGDLAALVIRTAPRT